MNRGLFDEIFQNELKPFIDEVYNNNSLIKVRDLSHLKYELYNSYMALNQQYKEQIFEKDVERPLLDRHKIASCICGAFLRCPVFDIKDLIEEIKKSGTRFEVYFVYVNELVALYAATAFLSFFMIREQKSDKDEIKRIRAKFPMAPPVTKNKRGFWNSVVFNLSQINDKSQIGTDHYDLYSYAMFFYWLEKDFNDNH